MNTPTSTSNASTHFKLEISQQLESAKPSAQLTKVSAELAHSLLTGGCPETAIRFSVDIGRAEQSAAKKPRHSSLAAQQKTQQSTEAVVTQLELQQRLTEAGLPVEGLTVCDEGVDPETEMVHVEFSPIPNRVIPKYQTVDGCLNAMIATFQSLGAIHGANAYHGNPEVENVIFQCTRESTTGTRLWKAYVTNFQQGGELANDPSKAPEDVKIALRDFGGRLLMAAERQGYGKINMLKTHIESQVNFADQDEPDALLSATVMHQHLRALKKLLTLSNRDYPAFPNRPWGPLNEEEVISAFQRT